VFVTNLNIAVSFHHKMAMKYCLEDDEIERQFIFNSDSDYCTEDEAGSAHDRGYKDENDMELVQLLSSSSSWGPPNSMAGEV
jgi:hypothetical protein